MGRCQRRSRGNGHRISWGGWVTGGSSTANAATASKAAVVQAFVPLCAAKAEQQPEQLVLLKKESSYSRDTFVVKAGWVSNVTEKYQSDVARAPSMDNVL